ncbi:MAG: hypothetical protein LBI13_04020 [Streptococcaceae bacterium]|jgi:hypothetical protein|nr:hypothetical protein [Streptococcaceae bacterium]
MSSNNSTIGVRKNGDVFTLDEWKEYWSKHYMPVNSDTDGWYRTMEIENDFNRAPASKAVEVVAQI